MKKMILSLLLATTFISSANANGIAGQIKKIYCDYRMSESIYNLENKTIKHISRTRADVRAILNVVSDDENNTLAITSERFGYVVDEVFKIAGKPYSLGREEDGIFVQLKLGTDECVGKL